MMNNVFVINNSAPNVSIVSLQRESSVLDGENAGRLKNGNLTRDVIGTFYNYALVVSPDLNHLSEYDDLYNTITSPVESHRVSMAFGQGVLGFDAYVTSASDELRRIGNKNIWKNLSFAVIAMEPQRYYKEVWESGAGSKNKVFSINGTEYDVNISKLERKGAVLDTDQTGRSKSGKMSREIIGTFYNYSMKIEKDLLSPQEYDKLYYTLTAPVDSHTLAVPYGQETLTFQAYVTKASDKLIKSNNHINVWSDLTIDFIAMQPARR